jgi:SAM-dependent methyltransferase
MRIEKYLRELSSDIYPQPPDVGHTAWAVEVLEEWKTKLSSCSNVLDVGCGEAFLQTWFEELGMAYSGVCIGQDFSNAKILRKTVYEMDFHSLDFPDSHFDLLLARHSLEHSPMPLLALMEWHRVCNHVMILVLPNPSYWGWAGRNHYSVMNEEQAKFLLDRSGWKVNDYDVTREELRYFCEKVERPVPFYED